VDQRPIITPINLPTIVVTGFVVGILALVLSMYNGYKLSSAFNRAQDLIVHYSQDIVERDHRIKDLERTVKQLQADVAALKGAQASDEVDPPAAPTNEDEAADGED